MKIQDVCKPCLKGLIEKTVGLSGGGEHVTASCLSLLDSLFVDGSTPPAIAVRLLAQIRRRTGVWDPYATLKHREFRDAVVAMQRIGTDRPLSLDDCIRLSAIGNSTDFFSGGTFGENDAAVVGDPARAAAILSVRDGEVLILGDNVGDFLFDLPLTDYLEKAGNKVFYAVRERPVQNDLSMEDVHRFGLLKVYPRIISTGKGNIGLPKEDIDGDIARLWRSDIPVIAKGMGNFETITEFDGERQVVYIMKVKCPAVARSVGSDIGAYIAHVR